MLSTNKGDRALRTYAMAHRFLHDFGIRWLPINPEDIIDQKPNWKMKYVSQVAIETGQTKEYIINHVVRSNDGITIYDVEKRTYCIIINDDSNIPPGRMLWTKMHEIGHIYLKHLEKYNTTVLHQDELGEKLYNELEFEADLFAGEVLASKWLMRQLDIYNEKDISEICGITDRAALNRYRKATEDYNYTPPNAVFTISRFEEYLKEVTVCADPKSIDLGRFSKTNPAHPKFKTPMAPFLRKPGICPYCGKTHNINARFCPYCGSMLRKNSKKTPGAYCWKKFPADVAYCEHCGNPVIRLRQGFFMEECEL